MATRPLVAALEPILKKPVVMETKAGAAGQVGAQFVASAKPDGYTLLTHNTSISGTPEVDKLFGRAPKFTNASFIPIARLVADPCVFVVNDQQPYKTMKEFIDDAKKRPDQIVFSTAGFYSAVHIPMALFMKAAGLQLRHLPTNGGGPALTALLGNNANVAILSLSGALAQIKAGKLRPLALMGGTRAKAIADVPTMKELEFAHRVLPLGWHFCAKGHARQRDLRSAQSHRRGGARQSVQEHAGQHGAGPRLHGRAGIREILGQGFQERRRRGGHHRQGQMTFARLTTSIAGDRRGGTDGST